MHTTLPQFQILLKSEYQTKLSTKAHFWTAETTSKPQTIAYLQA